MKNTLSLPSTLTRKFKVFERKLFFTETLLCLSGSLLGLVISYIFLFISDRFWNTPVTLRLFFILAGISVFALFLMIWLKRWILCKRSFRDYSRVIQKRFRTLGDRLLGIVELTEQKDIPENISAGLCRSAIKQVADESVQYDFRRSVKTGKTLRLCVLFIFFAGLITLLLSYDSSAFINALTRWANPFSNTPRYTFVKLHPLRDRKIVPHGEPFDVTCSAEKSSRWKPSSLYYWFSGGEKIRREFDGFSTTLKLNGQIESRDLHVRVEDANDSITIVPKHRPALTRLTAMVDYPEYLKRESKPVELSGNTLSLLKDSRFRLTGSVNRKLTEGAVVKSTSVVPFVPVIKGNTFSTPVFDFKGISEQIFLSWQDGYGLTPLEPCTVTLKESEDKPPHVECRDVGRYTAILRDEIIPFPVTAEDDYGIREISMRWHTKSSGEKEYPGNPSSYPLRQGSHDTRNLSGKFAFSPVMLNIPEETVTRIVATATDYKPNRPASRSVEYYVYVLSYSHHAQIIREKLERLKSRLDDLALTEEELMAANKMLNTLSKKDLLSKEAMEKLKQSLSGEDRNMEKMAELTDEGLKLLKEALRNKEISEQALNEWSKMMKMMKDISSSDMPNVIQSLQKARESKTDPRKNLADAIRQQKKILEKMKKMNDRMDKSLKKMAMENFANRLREAASDQNNVSVNLKKIAPSVLGLRADQLKEPVRKDIGSVSDKEGRIFKSVKYIKEDLYGFFTRTKMTIYDTIYQEMDDKGVLDGLKGLIRDIDDVKLVTSISGSKKWADQFIAWAEMLEKAGDSDQQSDSSDSELTEEQIELLLKLFRVIQREQQLRAATRALDEQKSAIKDYREKSIKLGDDQDGIYKQLSEVRKKVGCPQVRRLLDRAGKAMNDAEELLRTPDTGSKTIAAETEVIELLASGGQSYCKQCGAGASAAMQMLLAMLMQGSGAGSTGGGSMAGGTTDAPNLDLDGTHYSADEKKEADPKSAGKSLENVPTEYREMLNSYYKKLDAMDEMQH